MAGTRAEVRALEDMDDPGMTCPGELANLDEVLGDDSSGQGKSPKSLL